MDDGMRGPLPTRVAVLALATGLIGMTLAAGVPGLGTRVGLLVGQLVLLTPFALSAAALRTAPGEAFGLRPIGARDVVLAAGCGLGLWVASAGLIQLQYAVWPPPPDVFEFFERLHAKLDLWPPWQG